jgi:hypothetical protein
MQALMVRPAQPAQQGLPEVPEQRDPREKMARPEVQVQLEQPDVMARPEVQVQLELREKPGQQDQPGVPELQE